MKYKFFFKNFVALFILLIIPGCLIFLFKWEGLIYSIPYFQLLVIMAQAEIAERQRVMYSIQLEPFFNITRETISSVTYAYDEKQRRNLCRLCIVNESKNPAYRLGIARLIDKQNRPIPPNEWKNRLFYKKVHNLMPGQKVILGDVHVSIFEAESSIEVLYYNKLGELKELFIKLYKDKSFLIFQPERRMPGILLNMLENFRLFLSYQRLRKYLHSKNSLK